MWRARGADQPLRLSQSRFHSGPGTIRLPIRTQWLPDTEWVIHPLLPLGAYVVPHAEDAARVSRAEDLYISGMGPLTNFIFGLALIGLTVGIVPEWFVTQGTATSALLYAGLLIGIVAAMWALWRYRLFFCRRLAFLLTSGNVRFFPPLSGIYLTSTQDSGCGLGMGTTVPAACCLERYASCCPAGDVVYSVARAVWIFAALFCSHGSRPGHQSASWQGVSLA